MELDWTRARYVQVMAGYGAVLSLALRNYVSRLMVDDDWADLV